MYKSEVVGIGVIFIFHLEYSKLWKTKFSMLCDVIFSGEAAGEILKLITLGSERVKKPNSRNLRRAKFVLFRCTESGTHLLQLSPPEKVQ